MVEVATESQSFWNSRVAVNLLPTPGRWVSLPPPGVMTVSGWTDRTEPAPGAVLGTPLGPLSAKRQTDEDTTPRPGRGGRPAG